MLTDYYDFRKKRNYNVALSLRFQQQIYFTLMWLQCRVFKLKGFKKRFPKNSKVKKPSIQEKEY